MKKKFSVISIIMSAIALSNTAVYWSLRPIWFFIDKETGSFGSINNFWSMFILILLAALSVYSLTLLITRMRIRAHWIVLILFNLMFTGLNIYLCSMLGAEINIISKNLLTLIPGLLVTAAILFFIILFPETKLSESKKIRAVTAVLLLSLFFTYTGAPAGIRITSGPSIQYIDDERFAVIWTTNKKSAGWVEYGPDEAHLSTKQMSENGLIQANTRTHKVILDGRRNDNFIFRAGSRDIKQHFQNNVVYGKTVYSEFIEFNKSKYNDEISFYVLSDIHERKDIYEKYLSEDDYDFLVLNGDLLSSIDTEKVIIDEMLKPLSAELKGFKPFYFVRGNHETRGAAARDLPDYLALPGDSYYYTFSYGPVFGLVLDGGEDKEDSHEEYGGLADFESYRKIETEWLKEVAKSDAWKNAQYRIAFNHIPLNTYESPEDSTSMGETVDEWGRILNLINIDVLISGHTHKSDFIEADGERLEFPIIIGGGYTKASAGYEGIRVEADSAAMNIYVVAEDGHSSDIYTIKN